MKFLSYFLPVVVGMFVLVAKIDAATCNATGKNNQHRFHWSEPAVDVSPNGRWQVEVLPVLQSDENESPVILRDCQGGKTWQLFILQRSAELYWGEDGHQLLIIDKPTADDYRLLLFNARDVSERSVRWESDKIDKVVRKIILNQLDKEREVAFYFPGMVSWKKSQLVLSVGGDTEPRMSGPLIHYCFVIQIDSETLSIEKVLSSKDLKEHYNNSKCQESP